MADICTENLSMKSKFSLISCGERGDGLALGKSKQLLTQGWEVAERVLIQLKKIHIFWVLLFTKHLLSTHVTQKNETVYNLKTSQLKENDKHPAG